MEQLNILIKQSVSQLVFCQLTQSGYTTDLMCCLLMLLFDMANLSSKKC